MKTNYKISLFFVVCLMLSCNNENNKDLCNSENPFEMDWMQDWISELQYCVCTISIFQAKYDGQTVFWQLMNDPLCQSVITNVAVFNCLGEEILVLDDYNDWVTFNEKVTKRKIIYACPNVGGN